jgi:hypothetical protein
MTTKTKNPLRKIVAATEVNGIVKDVLECGHALQRRTEDGTGTYKRRCYRCRLGYPADVDAAQAILDVEDAAAEALQESYCDPRCGCPDQYARCPIHGPRAEL